MLPIFSIRIWERKISVASFFVFQCKYNASSTGNRQFSQHRGAVALSVTGVWSASDTPGYRKKHPVGVIELYVNRG